METSTIIDLVEEMIEKRVKPLEDRIAELEEKAAAATTAGRCTFDQFLRGEHKEAKQLDREANSKLLEVREEKAAAATTAECENCKESKRQLQIAIGHIIYMNTMLSSLKKNL